MLELKAEGVGKVRDRGGELAHEVAAEDDVTDQPPLRRVVAPRHDAELLDLAEIVEEHPEQQQVAIELAVVVGHLRGETEHRDDVLEQSAAESMMNRFGGGMDAQRGAVSSGRCPR